MEKDRLMRGILTLALFFGIFFLGILALNSEQLCNGHAVALTKPGEECITH